MPVWPSPGDPDGVNQRWEPRLLLLFDVFGLEGDTLLARRSPSYLLKSDFIGRSSTPFQSGSLGGHYMAI